MTPEPQQFARHWCAAWNRHDVEGVLSHFHEEVVFASPIAAQIVPESVGTVRGKAALRDYWARALILVPDLHFTIIGVYAGVGTIVIHYRNQRGIEVSEVLIFDGSLVREGHGTYPA